MGPLRCPTDNDLGEPCRRMAGHDGTHRFGPISIPTFPQHEEVQDTTTFGPRGFRSYADIPTRDDDTITVQESSLAGEGAHVHIFSGRASMFSARPHSIPDDARSSLHLNVRQALQLTSALLRWADDAMAGRLIEPAEVEDRTDG